MRSRHDILNEFKEAIQDEKQSAWASCFLALEASQSDGWLGWAEEFAEIMEKDSAQYAYDRAHAAYMHVAFSHLNVEKTKTLSKRGFSYFVACHPYLSKASLLELLEAIETASSTIELRNYLSDRYGNTTPFIRVIKKFFKKHITEFLGALESEGAPDHIRETANQLKKELKEWLGDNN